MIENGSARFIAGEVYRDNKPIVTVGSTSRRVIRVADWQRIDLCAEHGSAMAAARDLPRGMKLINVEGEEEGDTGQEGDDKEQAPDAVDPLVSLRVRPRCLG
jgi:hypothetical protein